MEKDASSSQVTSPTPPPLQFSCLPDGLPVTITTPGWEGDWQRLFCARTKPNDAGYGCDLNLLVQSSKLTILSSWHKPDKQSKKKNVYASSAINMIAVYHCFLRPLL